ncbi:unnamed protein product [Calypogeia fissa]
MNEEGSKMDGEEGAVEMDAGGGGKDAGDSGIDLLGGCIIDLDDAGGGGSGEWDDGSGEGPNEMMVPFMTVLKGDSVVESLCLVGQDIFVMGRCSCSADMLVGHATCSRQHVEIQIIHATREILLTDLASAHGTWVDGKRLPSMTPTLMKNSAAFQLGTSKRVYQIDWQPAPDVGIHPSSSDLSTSAETGAVITRELSPPSEAASVLSALRYSADNQDFLPSAPFPSSVDNFIFPDENSAPPGSAAVRRSVKRSPAKPGGELRKSVSSPKILFPQDENISPVVRNSPAVKPVKLTRSASSPTRPTRRLAFSALQPSSAVNVQSPRSSTSIKKPLAERSNSSGSLQPPPHSVSPKVPPFTKQPKATPPKAQQEANLTPNPSKLWLRRCNSSPLPVLATGNSVPIRPQAPRLAALNEHPDPEPKNGSAEQPYEDALSPTGSNKVFESADDEFSSGKENVDPKVTHSRILPRKKSGGLTSLTSRESSVKSVDREPFRPLHYTLEARPSFVEVPQASETIASSASSEVSSRVVGVPRPHKHRAASTGRSKSFTSSGYGSSAPALPRPHQRVSSSAVSSLDLLSPSEQLQRRLKLSDHPTEIRRQWHIVVDTNCLLDADSLKALKQLEGIREVDVIIPKIVVRELDCLKHRHGGKSNVRAALKWIQSCMVRLPSWIHVQSNLETRPVKATPPVSPTAGAFTQFSDLMSPTNEDHVLECALIFAALKAHYGKVALLTRDVALQIKAMAEGLVSESAPEFCESLLSPYSSRFLWVGSTAHGKTWADQGVQTNNPVSFRRGKSRASKSIQHLVEDLNHHVNTQPKGLQLVAELK